MIRGVIVLYFFCRFSCYAISFRPHQHHGYKQYKHWPEILPSYFHPILSRYRDLPPAHMPSLQSPINIMASQAAVAKLPDLVFEHILSNNVQINVRNTGSTVSFEIADSSASKPLLVGGPLAHNGVFEFNELHIHWGSRDKSGGEHEVNGRRYAIEGHCVHFNRKYGNFEEASKFTDGLAVVAFFFKAGQRDNPKLRQVVRVLPNITFPDSVVRMSARDALGWFAELGQPRNYFTYPGSLTTEPFTENVIWIVYPNAVQISSAQVDAFRSLLSTDLSALNQNIRPVQPFNGRPLIYTI